MPDYNPDQDRHTDHSFIVQNATQKKTDGLDTSTGKLKFNREGRFTVKDPGLAREIQQQYPTEAAVTRVRRPHRSDRGHRYHFGQWPEMPWKRQAQQEEGPAQAGESEEGNAIVPGS